MTENIVNLEDHKPKGYGLKGDGVADLWFYLQRYKKELRTQFLQDIDKMKAEGADTDTLLARLIRHERSVKAMRYAFDEVAENPNPTFDRLVWLCDEYGLSEFKERWLFVRDNGGRTWIKWVPIDSEHQ